MLIRIVFVIYIANGIDCLGRACDNCCDCFKEKKNKNEEINENEGINEIKEIKNDEEEEERKRREKEEEAKKLKEEEEKERRQKEEEEKRIKEQEEERKKKEENKIEEEKRINIEKIGDDNKLKKGNDTIDFSKGAFGYVSKYYDTKNNENVAIKRIPLKSREYNIVNKLKKHHNINIVDIKEIFNDAENYYIVEELCDCTISGYYRRYCYELEENERMCFFFQLINGIEFLHSLQIAHNDIKIDNILVNKEGILKICDFGTCLFYIPGTECRFYSGTEKFMAPEVYEKKQHDLLKSDIWSCGLILWSLFCKKLITILQPQKGEDFKTYIARYYSNIKNIKLEHLEECKNESVRKLVMQMLSYNPDDRPTIEQIKQTIEKYPGKI